MISQDGEGLAQVAGSAGAATRLAEDLPALQLSVGAFAEAAEPGVGAVGLFLGGGPVPALYGVTLGPCAR
ncbi:hypothetical protein GCM10017600_08830 [Streptosporangium carneum]|uniref:Uncharacterized protein n=1 Tax=Streptosporangium carneum TaxID=47481 RepID=A0A9W6HXM2_9ACTN|nr:hypothetical protein GCM10017600_08830 [Streptosporangium carneum]